MMDAQEMRRRWSNKTAFTASGAPQDYVYGPEDHDLEIDFQNCQSIVFMNGDSLRGEDLLLMARGGGHVTLPAGVSVRVTQGHMKLGASTRAGADAASSVVSAGYAPIAPPPTRATSYVGSSTGSSSYRTPLNNSASSRVTATSPAAERRRPSPPRNAAGFNRAGSHIGSYAAAQHGPMSPAAIAEARARAAANDPGDWEVVGELEGAWDVDSRSVAPSESVSSVGSRGMRPY